MARRVSLLIGLLGAAAWAVAWVPAMHAQTSTPPSVQISNGAITATVYLPDATAGYYRGTRFDWAGVIGRLEYRRHTFYAPWFTKTDAAVRDFVNDGVDVTAGPHTAVTGPAEEFSVLGFTEAAPGGAFVKIGVGALRKPDDGSAYSAYRSYEFADAGKRTVAPRPDGVDFTHELADNGSGFGYHYTKNVRLNPGRPELVIAHRLVNRGAKPIVGTVYNHNFLVLDGQDAGTRLRDHRAVRAEDRQATRPCRRDHFRPGVPVRRARSGYRARRGAVPGLRPHRGGLPLHD